MAIIRNAGVSLPELQSMLQGKVLPAQAVRADANGNVAQDHAPLLALNANDGVDMMSASVTTMPGSYLTGANLVNPPLAGNYKWLLMQWYADASQNQVFYICCTDDGKNWYVRLGDAYHFLGGADLKYAGEQMTEHRVSVSQPDGHKERVQPPGDLTHKTGTGYRKYASGTLSSSGTTVADGGILDILDVTGWIKKSGVNEYFPLNCGLPSTDGQSQMVLVPSSVGYDLKLVGRSAKFTGQNYEASVHYTK